VRLVSFELNASDIAAQLAHLFPVNTRRKQRAFECSNGTDIRFGRSLAHCLSNPSLAAGIVMTTKAPEAAKKLINFISSPVAAQLLRANVSEPR
jgi:hypothetical protein